MIALPAGRLLMGSDEHYPEEQPVHEEHVAAFLMNEHPVTNAEFRRFVKDTGYRTTAEVAPRPEDFLDADPADLVAGSLVFRATAGPVPLDDWRRWWHWMPSANWRAPEGPGSGLGGRERHPVVHVSYEDALAYAAWAGKDLPPGKWNGSMRPGPVARRRPTLGVRSSCPGAGRWRIRGTVASRGRTSTRQVATAPPQWDVSRRTTGACWT